MAKQTFTLNDFSGGANGYVDPLDIADNELAICQGFKAEPDICGTSREEAMETIRILEVTTQGWPHRLPMLAL